MKSNLVCRFAVALAVLCVFAHGARAQTPVPGTFKHITVDGSFDDWTGVPLAYNAPDGATNAIEYNNIYIANDLTNLYIRFTLYNPRPNAFANSFDNIFIDADDNVTTGFQTHGIGSEMLVQWGGGYQEKNGGFNEGVVNGLGWALAGSPDSLDFELSISLGATYASDGTSVFTSTNIALLLEGDDTGYTSVESAPPSGGLVYTLAPNPGSISGSIALISLTNSWEVNAAGTDLGTNWLGQTYDDTQAGWSSGPGLLGYTTSPGSYPAIHTALSSGPNTYYFRTHFQWTNDPTDLAFVVSNYLSDGAVYYLNGTEVKRIRMPSGAVAFTTPATGTNFPAGSPFIFGLNGAVLQSGDNILEVEAHQAPGSGADMVFGLSLTAATQYPVLIVNTNLPADQTVLAGQPVTFTSDVIGSGPLTYQWYFDGTNAIAGANSATYTIPTVLTNNAGTYSLTVSNPNASATTRAALLTVSSTPVVIATQPANAVAVEGKPATFTVAATGTPLIQYQWFHNSTPVGNATNAVYTIASVEAADAGAYYVTVSNPAGAANSAVATLTILRDAIPPSVAAVGAGPAQVTVTFSEPVDSVTGGNAANYAISGGIGVSTATPNPNNATQVTLTTGAALNFGTVYALTIHGVDDLFGNAASTTVYFTRDITIDGSFDDWTGLSPVLTNAAPSGNTNAADFEAIYVYNDASYYYFHVTLWTDINPNFGQFPFYVNMFFDTDNDPTTGYQPVGSEMLIQSGFNYQERNGGFNDGVGINGLNWLCLPVAPGTNFEFRISRSATFQDGTPLFTTNEFQFEFQGMTPGFVVENTVPGGGATIGYSNITPVTVPPLPLGALSITALPGGSAAIVWDSPGVLQSKAGLTGAAWTSLPSATSPYVIPAAGQSQFFRLSQP